VFKFFQKKKKKLPPQLMDIGGNLILEGDEVICHRYDLGESKVELEGLHFYYVSLASGQKVSYTKMIDAITENQKVEKIF
jgi:hypothetical protein